MIITWKLKQAIRGAIKDGMHKDGTGVTKLTHDEYDRLRNGIEVELLKVIKDIRSSAETS